MKLEEKRIQQIKLSLLRIYPFYGYILMRLPLIFDLSGRVKRAATNGKYIFVNPRWSITLNNSKVKTVLVHECRHVLNCHHLRIGMRYRKIYNRAADYIINYQLIHDDKLEPLENWCYNPEYSPRFYSTETLYTKLFEEYGAVHVVYGHLHSGSISNALSGIVRGVNYMLVSCDAIDFKLAKII